jgi:hypothetical protein
VSACAKVRGVCCVYSGYCLFAFEPEDAKNSRRSIHMEVLDRYRRLTRSGCSVCMRVCCKSKRDTVMHKLTMSHNVHMVQKPEHEITERSNSDSFVFRNFLQPRFKHENLNTHQQLQHALAGHAQEEAVHFKGASQRDTVCWIFLRQHNRFAVPIANVTPSCRSTDTP